MKAIVADPDQPERIIAPRGRDAWALLELVKAGARGCTPIDHPGPRWSGYVHNLRREYGLQIETVHERHGPPFSGTHARYVLRSVVRIVAADGQEPEAA
ncbi:MAG: hypothetical protein FJ311_06250 [Rhodospirillales bacterium]|nr:hypothetical protein [Rhodospirillales bacterium]